MTTLNISRAPTTRLLRACARFGLSLHTSPDPQRDHHISRAARRIVSRPALGHILLIRGPSGAGKSTLLRACAARLAILAAPTVRIDPTDGLERRPEFLPDLFPGHLTHALRALARAGLAEARLLARTPAELSDGERWRLRLALALHQIANRIEPTWLIADEFASTLDTHTAHSVACALRRHISPRSHAIALLATPRNDLEQHLRPDLVLHLSLGPNSPDAA